MAFTWKHFKGEQLQQSFLLFKGMPTFGGRDSKCPLLSKTLCVLSTLIVVNASGHFFLAIFLYIYIYIYYIYIYIYVCIYIFSCYFFVVV